MVAALPWWTNGSGPTMAAQRENTSMVGQLEWTNYGGTTVEVLLWWTSLSGPTMVEQRWRHLQSGPTVVVDQV